MGVGLRPNPCYNLLMIVQTELDRKHYTGWLPPQYLTDLMTRIGGTNMFGEPHFRLVWGPDRLTPSGGTWVDWLPDTSQKDRRQWKGNKPYKRVAEVRMIPRYGPVVGWCLERWVPAKAYGSREQWYAPSIIGGTMVLVNGGKERIPSQGEYPSRGDYEYTGSLFKTEELAEATVIPIVQALILGLESLPTDPARRIAVRSQIANAAAQAADDAYETWALDMIDDMQPAFKGQIMLGAGTKRSASINEVCKRLGITEHSGRS